MAAQFTQFIVGCSVPQSTSKNGHNHLHQITSQISDTQLPRVHHPPLSESTRHPGTGSTVARNRYRSHHLPLTTRADWSPINPASPPPLPSWQARSNHRNWHGSQADSDCQPTKPAIIGAGRNQRPVERNGIARPERHTMIGRSAGNCFHGVELSLVGFEICASIHPA